MSSSVTPGKFERKLKEASFDVKEIEADYENRMYTANISSKEGCESTSTRLYSGAPISKLEKPRNQLNKDNRIPLSTLSRQRIRALRSYAEF